MLLDSERFYINIVICFSSVKIKIVFTKNLLTQKFAGQPKFVSLPKGKNHTSHETYLMKLEDS